MRVSRLDKCRHEQKVGYGRDANHLNLYRQRKLRQFEEQKRAHQLSIDEDTALTRD